MSSKGAPPASGIIGTPGAAGAQAKAAARSIGGTRGGGEAMSVSERPERADAAAALRALSPTSCSACGSIRACRCRRSPWERDPYGPPDFRDDAADAAGRRRDHRGRRGGWCSSRAQMLGLGAFARGGARRREPDPRRPAPSTRTASPTRPTGSAADRRPERRLEIMKDSRIGSYGGAALMPRLCLARRMPRRAPRQARHARRGGGGGARRGAVAQRRPSADDASAAGADDGLVLRGRAAGARRGGRWPSASAPRSGSRPGSALALPFAGIVLAFLLAGGVALAMTRAVDAADRRPDRRRRRRDSAARRDRGLSRPLDCGAPVTR